MNKGYVVTYLPFKKYVILMIIIFLFYIAFIYYPLWYPKLESLALKLNPSTSDITTLQEIRENPETYDNKTVTTEGQTYGLIEKNTWNMGVGNVFEGYYMLLTKTEGYSYGQIKTTVLTNEQLNYVKNISTCVNSQPIFRVIGTIKVNYYQTSEFSKSVSDIEIMPTKIEFVRCNK